MATRRRLLQLLLIVTLAACVRPPKQGTPPMTVELDVYSGRPNPAWPLSAGEAEQVARSLTDLPRAEAPAEEGLGYRGFVLIGTDRDGHVPDPVRVHAGIVTIRRGGRDDHFVDAHGLEERLLQQARDHGFGGVVEALRPK